MLSHHAGSLNDQGQIYSMLNCMTVEKDWVSDQFDLLRCMCKGRIHQTSTVHQLTNLHLFFKPQFVTDFIINHHIIQQTNCRWVRLPISWLYTAQLNLSQHLLFAYKYDMTHCHWRMMCGSINTVTFAVCVQVWHDSLPLKNDVWWHKHCNLEIVLPCHQ